MIKLSKFTPEKKASAQIRQGQNARIYLCRQGQRHDVDLHQQQPAPPAPVRFADSCTAAAALNRDWSSSHGATIRIKLLLLC